MKAIPILKVNLTVLLIGALAIGAISNAQSAKADMVPQETSGPVTLKKADGFNGIWYMNQPSKDEYKYKYSGGFATYPQQHNPLAIYSPEAHKTFFCYGGSEPGKRNLLHMLSYYDHLTGEIARPRILLDKQTNDAHENPVIAIDDKGYITVFSPSHGGNHPTYISKSTKPYSIDEFQISRAFDFSYPQPKYIKGKGFLFLHTRYKGGRALYMVTSKDGETWENERMLARMGEGHYQVSGQRENGSVATAFNYHPKPGGLNHRTNLYYMETPDMGETWTTADGRSISLPVTTTDSITLVHDYERENLLVYMKDLAFDSNGHPVILYVTSKGYESGPANDPRTWRTARFTGSEWQIDTITTSTNNYDYGPLYIEADGTWRIIAPTTPGPQPYNPGGEIVMWVSNDQGKSWIRQKQLTANSKFNNTFVRRPVNANADFYAFWADGHARKPSDSSLYFTNKDGSKVLRLPRHMSADLEKPEMVSPK